MGHGPHGGDGFFSSFVSSFVEPFHLCLFTQPGNRKEKKKKNMSWPEAETSHVPDDTDTCTVGYGVSVGDTPVVLQGERVGAGEGGHLRSPGASLSITALQAEKNNTQLHVSH